MTATFDPYQQWLGIAPQQQPVDHYRLVGVQRFEANLQTIVAACQQQTMKVAPHVSGNQAEEARRLLNELTVAQAVLLNPTEKTSYDDQLRSALASATQAVSTPPSAPHDDGRVKRPQPRGRDGSKKSDAPSSEAAAVGAASTAASDQPSSSHSREPAAGEVEAPVTAAGFIPWVMGGGLAGLMAAIFVGLLMLIGRGLTGNSPEEPSLEQSPTIAMGADVDQSPRHGRSIPPDPSLTYRLDDPLAPKMAPATTVPTDLGTMPATSTRDDSAATITTAADDDGDMTTPDDAADATTKPVRANPLVNLTSAIELPNAVDDGGSVNESMVSLGPIDLDDDHRPSLKLIRDTALPGDVARFELQPDGDDPRRWEVRQSNPSGQQVSVAEYFIASGELQFRWLADAGVTGADNLRNSVLQIAVDEHNTMIPLREAKTLSPLVMKFDGGAVAVSVDIDSIPENKKLQLAVTPRTDDFPEHQFDPASQFVEDAQTDIWFGKAGDSMRLVLRLTLGKIGTRRFKVEARPMLNVANSGKKLDYFKPASAARELNQLKQQQIALQTQIDEVARIYRRDRVRQAQASAALGQQMQQLQTRIDTLESIATLCQSLHGEASLGLRLFMTVDEHEIDLARSTPLADAASVKGDAS